jgi:hypothetical protein
MNRARKQKQRSQSMNRARSRQAKHEDWSEIQESIRADQEADEYELFLASYNEGLFQMSSTYFGEQVNGLSEDEFCELVHVMESNSQEASERQEIVIPEEVAERTSLRVQRFIHNFHFYFLNRLSEYRITRKEEQKQWFTLLMSHKKVHPDSILSGLSEMHHQTVTQMLLPFL